MKPKCEHCNRIATGRINDHHFCSAPACLQAVITNAFRDIKLAARMKLTITLETVPAKKRVKKTAVKNGR